MSKTTFSDNFHAADIYFLVLKLLFLIIPLGNVFPVEKGRASVLTYMIIPSDDSLTTLGDVINDSILLELKIAGFETPHSKIKKELIEISSIIKSASESGSQFLILDSYELNDDHIRFRIDCYETSNSELLISIEKDEQIGFFLDSAINESMSEVIKKIDERVPELPVFVTEEKEGKLQEEEKTDFSPQNIINNTIDDDKTKKILLSAAVSPFMTTGEAGKYFTHGWEFYLYGGYPFKIKLFDFYAGLFILANRFSSEGILISSDNTFLTFGPETRVLFNLTDQLLFFTNAALGITVFMMKSDVENTRSTVLPHLSFGAGAEKIFDQQWSGYLHLRYSFYFEESLLITGFSPSVGVNFRI